ncbi:MAG: hypothetical protein SFV24_16945 [Gemmatimonadales bacterium]|nr:hypothetical protein [Gemmatimonadales bacterium]
MTSTPTARIYLAAPITVYGTPAWCTANTRVTAAHPGSIILNPMAVFRDRRDWQARLPAVLRGVTRLVFLTDAEGFIGRGVDHEIASAIAVGCPVERLTVDGAFVPLAALVIDPPTDDDWSHYRRVRTPSPGPA